MQLTSTHLRHLAIAHSLFSPTSLSKAIDTLGFIQADPIRSPARAQDLILRQRVTNYSVNDLERHYPNLELEEDFLYAHGFLTRSLHHHLYPRKLPPLSFLEKRILRVSKASPRPLDTRELEKLFGQERAINGWGGYSKSIRLALDNLHYAGLLRISGREKGQRIYSIKPTYEKSGSETERLEYLVMAVVQILGPVTERTLHEALARTRQHIGDTNPVIEKLVKQGILERHTIDQVRYIWPADAMTNIHSNEPQGVKFLAPFDPLVWDRRRFEHLWGWAYRFEAYTPAVKRVRGYYAMPLLWGDQIVGWANISMRTGSLHIETGFVDKPITDPKFKQAFAEEANNMQIFLGARS